LDNPVIEMTSLRAKVTIAAGIKYALEAETQFIAQKSILIYEGINNRLHHSLIPKIRVCEIKLFPTIEISYVSDALLTIIFY